MKSHDPTNRAQSSRRKSRRWFSNRLLALIFALVILPSRAHASLFQGETLDKVADILAWVVLIVAPTVGIAVFWIIHILPEKIAEKRHHPQSKAIQCLCLLSLAFGGLLWPLAWLWAFTKPVLHRIAYGTDVDKSHGHSGSEAELPASEPVEGSSQPQQPAKAIKARPVREE